MSLLVYYMSPFCSDLIFLITKAPPNTALLRKIIRKFTLGDETFDPIIHVDLSFVEVVATHFLNLIVSPRNPLQYVCMERTTASLTTAFILNNQFLSNNDIVDFGWFEREIQTTSTTKWDGVAFAIKDKKITPVLVEFSGGVKFSTTDKKEQDDETKMVGKVLNILKYIEALQMVNYSIP